MISLTPYLSFTLSNLNSLVISTTPVVNSFHGHLHYHNRWWPTHIFLLVSHSLPLEPSFFIWFTISLISLSFFVQNEPISRLVCALIACGVHMETRVHKGLFVILYLCLGMYFVVYVDVYWFRVVVHVSLWLWWKINEKKRERSLVPL